jgi:hypothetical protein
VSMFENMVICVEILLSLDISVNCAQCVKIWLFLKCVQFSEVLCSVFAEAKERRAYITHVSHLSKGRHVLWRRVSLLLNMHKKIKPTDYSPWECSLYQHASCLLARICQTYLHQQAHNGPMQEASRGTQAV